jgi:hypothetical protein
MNKRTGLSKIYDNKMKPAIVFDGRAILDTVKLNAIGFVVDVIGEKTAI